MFNLLQLIHVLFLLLYRNNLLHQISNLNQTQKFSVGDLTNLKIVLSMANNNSPLDYSPITYNLPTLLFESIPSWIVSILTKWNSVPVGPVVKVCIFIY
jgi:hypothetical protein